MNKHNVCKILQDFIRHLTKLTVHFQYAAINPQMCIEQLGLAFGTQSTNPQTRKCVVVKSVRITPLLPMSGAPARIRYNLSINKRKQWWFEVK